MQEGALWVTFGESKVTENALRRVRNLLTFACCKGDTPYYNFFAKGLIEKKHTISPITEHKSHVIIVPDHPKFTVIAAIP